MVSIYTSLLAILLVITLAPFVASLVPGRAIPEVVFLVFAGAILGGHGLGFIDAELAPIQLISDLGLGFLFLKAGFEINPRDLFGHTGKVAAWSWVGSFVLGLALSATVFARHGFNSPETWIALAISMTTTAYGTLAPIMRDRGLVGTRVGKIVTIYGSYGELLPIVAMSFLLSSHSLVRTLESFVLLGLVFSIVLGLSSQAKRAGAQLWRFLVENAGHAAQPILRLVELILILFLLAVEIFGFDPVLGAFAAGFILRALFPEGNESMEDKIDVISNGFFQPIFFVASGAMINLAAAASNISLLISFIAALFVVRGVMVFVGLVLDRDTRDMSWRERLSTAAYCTMALPVVVAVTSTAVEGGVMQQTTASVLVTSAALTVILIPVLTSFIRVVDEVAPARAARELAQHETLRHVLHEHAHELRERERAYHELAGEKGRHGRHMASTDYFALSEHLSDVDAKNQDTKDESAKNQDTKDESAKNQDTKE